MVISFVGLSLSCSYVFFDFLFVFNLVLVLKMRPRGYLFWKLAPNSPPLHHKGLRSGEDSPQLRVQQSSQSSLMGEQLVDLRLPSVSSWSSGLWGLPKWPKEYGPWDQQSPITVVDLQHRGCTRSGIASLSWYVLAKDGDRVSWVLRCVPNMWIPCENGAECPKVRFFSPWMWHQNPSDLIQQTPSCEKGHGQPLSCHSLVALLGQGPACLLSSEECHNIIQYPQYIWLFGEACGNVVVW